VQITAISSTKGRLYRQAKALVSPVKKYNKNIIKIKI